MRDRILTKLAEWQSAHPGRVLGLVLLMTVICGGIASRLSVTMRWSDLLPSRDRRTIQFNRIIDEFTSATSLVVVVQGEEEKIKAYADALAPRIPELVDSSSGSGEGQGDPRPLFRRVDYKTEVGFLREHGLMLIKEEDLVNMKPVFTDPNIEGLLLNISRAMEREYVGREESLSNREKEDTAVQFLDGIERLTSALERTASGEALADEEIRAVVDRLLIGEPYLLSYDEKALILNVIPNFTMLDTDKLVAGTDAVQGLIDEMAESYPDVRAGLTGFIAVGRDEMVYAEKSLGVTTLLALIAILALLTIAFRMWIAPLLALFNLLVGLVWAVAAVVLLVGQLNIMTQMMAVILLGLGIDFSIHLISGFTEHRAGGRGIEEALRLTFLKSGKGILTGGATTACAFLALLVSHSRGMKEMGVVTGAGLLAVLLVTFLLLPALLVLRERRRTRRDRPPAARRDLSFRWLGSTARVLGRRWLFTLAAVLAATAALVWSGLGISFDHNYMNIEPAGLESITLQDTVLEKFDLGMDYALVLTGGVDRSRELARACRDSGSVAVTEDISLYLPSADEQERRRPHILEIRDRLSRSTPRSSISAEEIPGLAAAVERLEMNVLEMQDMAFLAGRDKVDVKCRSLVGNPENPSSENRLRRLGEKIVGDPARAAEGLGRFQSFFAPDFREAGLAMCSSRPIRLEDLPETILDRYANADRDLFLVTVFPAGNVWQDAAFLERFVGDLERVSDQATGMPPVFRALIEIIGRDGRIAMLLTLVIVFMLLCLDFRSPRLALTAMIPLGLGVFWMLGLMRIVGMQLTVMNVMGLPMILGIGIDDGVHIVHRWREEGAGRLRTIFASTGKAILLTSLTTMLGFGSLVFSIWRGFGQLGGALFLGVGACFLTTVIGLAGIIGWRERRRPENR